MVQRRPKTPEEDAAMTKSVILTPNSSVKSSTATTDETNHSETRDSFYFPGCRKDANCSCDICIASINATLDLMPQSIHRSSLTKLSVSSKPSIRRSPIAFPSSSADLSTPPKKRMDSSPPLDSTASTKFQEKSKRGKKSKESGYGFFAVRLILGLILILGVECGLSWVVSRVLTAKLSPDLVKKLGENSSEIEGLKGKFTFLKNELEGLIGGDDVSSCTSVDSVWKISQDGLLLNSRCVLYESMAEEISVWGWPLQTSGLLTAEYSPRHFTVLTGRVTEWSSEEANYTTRVANSSWIIGKWSSSVVQFDPNTWILEYKQSFLMNNAKLVSTIMEFLKFRITRGIEMLKKEFWLPSATFGCQIYDFTGGKIPIPT